MRTVPHSVSDPTSLDPRDETSWLRLLALALDSATNGIVIASNTPNLPIVYCNAAFEQLTGYPKAEILGRNCRFLQGQETDPKAREQMRAAFAAHHPIDLVILNYHKDGTPFWNALNIGPLRHEEGQVTHFIGVQTDVTERVHTQRQLEEQALTDALTGLPNRAHFLRELGRAATDPAAQGGFAVGFINLDGFKAINDTLGHEAGDALLIQVGAAPQACGARRGPGGSPGGRRVCDAAAGRRDRRGAQYRGPADAGGLPDRLRVAGRPGLDAGESGICTARPGRDLHRHVGTRRRVHVHRQTRWQEQLCYWHGCQRLSAVSRAQAEQAALDRAKLWFARYKAELISRI